MLGGLGPRVALYICGYLVILFYSPNQFVNKLAPSEASAPCLEAALHPWSVNTFLGFPAVPRQHSPQNPSFRKSLSTHCHCGVQRARPGVTLQRALPWNSPHSAVNMGLVLELQQPGLPSMLGEMQGSKLEGRPSWCLPTRYFFMINNFIIKNRV